ncbi:MAG: trypsin-like peptidase domain-containing protein [bacterium]|nr:trypsin-like peptidase domain-containing protein [bacterium]
MNKYFITLILWLCICINIAHSQTAPEKTISDSDTKDDNLNAEQIIEKYKPALISIWMNDPNFYSYTTYTYIDTTVLNGSGFIITEDGLVGTNYHVVESIDSLIVKTSDGTFYNAELVMIDEKNDFALLKIIDSTGTKFPTVKFGNSNEVKAGQEVFAIGSPLGFEYTISSGIVAAIRDNEKVNFSDPATYLTKEKTFEKVIQVTAAISPGNSGGALFNTKGEVIGITTYTYIGYGNLNFAVAINGFKNLIALAESTDFENVEAIKLKKEESLFNSNYKIASSLKAQLAYDWYYTKQKDTMTVVDTFIVRQDSINKINFTKAEKYYDKCIELKPDTFIVYQDLLDLYVFTDNFQKAEDLYKDIRENFNSDSLLNLLSSSLASAYSTSKDYKKAIQFYKKMLAQDTTQYFIYYQIANLYSQMNDNKNSVSEYNKLIRLDSGYTDAYVQLGKIYYENYKNTKRAKKYLQTAYEKELMLTGYTPYNSELHYYLGMIAVKEGRKLDAILAYMDLKNTYDSMANANEKKVKLYKAISSMDE